MAKAEKNTKFSKKEFEERVFETETIRDYQKILHDIDKIYDKIGGQRPAELIDSNNLEEVAGLITKAREEYYRLNDLVSEQQEGLKGLVTQWNEVYGSVKRSNEGYNLATRSVNKLKDISSQIRDSQYNLNDLSSREIEKLSQKAKIEIENLRTSKKLLETKLQSLSYSDKEYKKTQNALLEINKLLKEEDGLIQTTLNSIKEQAKAAKNVEDSMGMTGVALNSMEGILNKLGATQLGDMFGRARDRAKEVAHEVTNGGKTAAGFTGRVKILGKAFGSLATDVKKLFLPLSLITLAITAIVKLFGFLKKKYEEGRDLATQMGDANVELARGLGLAQGAANGLVAGLAGVGPSLEASVSSISSIYQALGSTEKISKNSLKTMMQLNIYAGFSAESLASFHQYAKASGKETANVLKNVANTSLQQIKNLKISISQKELMKKISETSNEVKLRFLGQDAALTRTVATAFKLGVEMKKMEEMARGLLNFEDSIQAEMEAELLTGKQLNLEKARELALQGKNEEAGKLLIEQAGGLHEFQQMNVLQQESLAKAIGMTREGMMDMYYNQKKNASAQGDLVDGQKDGLAAMKSGIKASEAEAARDRANRADSLGYYSKLKPLSDALEKNFRLIKQHLFRFLEKHLLDPLMKFVNSPEGKEFFEKTIPNGIKKFFDTLDKVVTTIKRFIKDNPTLMKVLGGTYAAHHTIKFLGLYDPLKKLFGMASDKLLKPGYTRRNPLYVEVTNNGQLGMPGAGMPGAGLNQQIMPQAKARDPKVKTVTSSTGVTFREGQAFNAQGRRLYGASADSARLRAQNEFIPRSRGRIRNNPPIPSTRPRGKGGLFGGLLSMVGMNYASNAISQATGGPSASGACGCNSLTNTLKDTLVPIGTNIATTMAVTKAEQVATNSSMLTKFKNQITKIGSTIGNQGAKLVNSLVKSSQNAYSFVKNGLTSAFKGFKNSFSSFFKGPALNSLKNVFNSIKNSITSSVIKPLTGMLQSGIQSLTSKASSLYSMAKSSISNTVGNVIKKGQNLMKPAMSAMSSATEAGASLFSRAKNYGKGLITRGKDVVKSGIKTAADTLGLSQLTKWLKSNIKSFLPKLVKGSKNTIRGIGKKIPIVGTVIEGLMTGMDIRDMAANQRQTVEQLESNIGKSIISSGLGLLGGTLAASLISAPATVGIPSWLLAPLAYTAGDFLGRQIGSLISDYIGGPKLGKLVIDAFYDRSKYAKGVRVDDFIKTNDGTLLKHNPNDIILKYPGGIMGGTDLLGGKKSKSYSTYNAPSETDKILKRQNEILEKLLKTVEKGGDIYMDGQKVGKQIALNSSRLGK